jgi:hypothetical protein
MTAIVQVRGISFDVTNAAEPMARDEDLGRFLGFTRPENIRNLIKRTFSKNPNDIRQSFTVKRYESRPGVWQERTVNEYWLTQAQSLKVIARSETDVADAVLDDMIAVYLEVRSGRTTVGPAPMNAATLAEIVGSVLAAALPRIFAELDARVDARLAALPAAPKNDNHGMIGKTGANTIRRRIRDIAASSVGGEKHLCSSARMQLELQVRGVVGHTGLGSRWETLPFTHEATAHRFLDVMETFAKRSGVRVRDRRQGLLNYPEFPESSKRLKSN